MSDWLNTLIMGLLAIAGLLIAYFRASAVRNKSFAEFMERRATSAEAQADAMARIEMARNRARQVGEQELKKIKAALNTGQRDQLEDS